MEPQLVVVGEAPSATLHYYPGYNTITQNSAGDIVFECISNKVHIYISKSDYSVDFLSDDNEPNSHGCYYLGTLTV